MSESPQALDPRELLDQAGRLQSIARRLVGDGHLAEDLVQDTWVAALEAERRKPEQNKDAEGWRAWARAVTRNVSLRRRRRDSKRREVEQQAARLESEGGVDDLAERLEWQRRLTNAIEGLDEPYRSALVLRYLDGRSPAEIAERQGISKVNARRRVSRALDQLRAELGVEKPSRNKTLGLLLGWMGFGRRFGGEASSATLSIKTSLALGGAVMGTKVLMGVAAAAIGVALVATVMDEEKPVHRELPLGIEQESVESVAVATATEEPQSEVNSSTPRAVSQERVEIEGNQAGGAQVAANQFALRGRVTGVSGLPLESVDVRWAAEGEEPVEEKYVGSTDEAGEFRLPAHPELAQVHLELEGYLPQFSAASAGDELDLTLLRRPQFSGQVRGPKGELPAPPGRIRAFVIEEGNEEPTRVEASLDEEGRYAFADLPAGRLVRLWAQAKGYEEVEEQLELDLLAESTHHKDLVLPQGLIVEGVVIDEETGEPIPFAEIWSGGFDYEADSVDPTTVADESGRFRITGIASDERKHESWSFFLVQLSARSETHAASPLQTFFLQEDGDGVCHVELKLVQRSCSLKVVIYEHGGERLARGVLVWGVDAENNFELKVANGQGEVDFEGLPAGKFGLAAYRMKRDASGMYSAILYETDLRSQSEESITLELRADAETVVEGRVLDASGRPRAGETVVLRYDLRFGSLAIGLDKEEQETDADGRYRFEGLREGKHRVEVKGCSEPSETGFQLKLGEARRGVDFVVGECMTISGQVAGLEGSEGSFKLRLTERGSEEAVRERGPEEDGSFEFENILQGTYELQLIRDDEEIDAVLVSPVSHTSLQLVVN